MLSECLKLGEQFLLKVQFSEKSKEMPNFHKYSMKRNGGEIAIFTGNNEKTPLKLYNSFGEHVNSIPISSGNVAEIGWSFKEELLEVLYSDGRFQVLSGNFQDYTEVSIIEGEESEEIVLEAKLIEDESITVLTSENNFIYFDLFEMKKFKFIRPECLEFNSPQCWMPTPDCSVVFALNSCIYRVTKEDELIQKNLGYETIFHLDIDNESVDIDEFTVEVDVNIKEAIEVYSISGISWLTNSKSLIAALFSSSRGKVYLFDLKDGENIQLNFPKHFITSREPDGLRIFKDGQSWLITMMPSIMTELNTGTSQLSKFYELYMKNDFEAIKALPTVKLSEIIDESSKALIFLAFERNLQSNFIEALKFAVNTIEEKLGREENSRHTFSYITANFNRALIECSVLSKIQLNGFATSPEEFNIHLSRENLLIRLCHSNLHSLAFEIAVLLDQDVSIILMDWVKKVIELSKLDEKEIYDLISDKLFTWKNQRATQINYINLAELAMKRDKFKLALKLLKFEPDSRSKIDMLVQLNDYREAVVESVKSGKEDQVSSKSFYSMSMGPSIDELKAAAASRAESMRTPSSSSLLQPSASRMSLNLPKEPIRNRINLRASNQFIDSFQPSTIPSTSASNFSPQENLRATAQTINGLIQKDKIQPDLAELLNGQFSREYIYGEEHRPILQFTKHSLIPEILLNQVRHNSNSGNCFMGMFPEIRRAWLVSGNELYLWSFENNRDFTHYLKSQYEIIDVALVRPRAGVFNENIEWLLVVVTPIEISLLALVFKSPDQHDMPISSGFTGDSIKIIKDYSNFDLILHETGLIFPSDEVNMVSICGTDDGRLFLAGSDGNIYELIYKEESSWFTSKCSKINRTASTLSYIVPTFLRSAPNRSCVVKLNYDSSRHILYGLTEQSTIHVYWLGPNGKDFEFIGVTGDLGSEAVKLTPAGIISSSKALDIISIHPVDFCESDVINLVAICRSGIRLYFSLISSIPQNINNIGQGPYSTAQSTQSRFSSPRGIRLVHLRAPPEENRVRDPKKLVHRWSPNIHSAFYSNGVTLAANTISNEEDLLLGMIINPSVGSNSSTHRLPLEYYVEAGIDGKVWSIEELPPLEEPIDSDIKGLGKEFALAHLSPRRFFAILTNVGVYVYSKLRPVDQLFLLLSEHNLPWDQLEKFFASYGSDQACAFCISLCCRSSAESRTNSPYGSEIAMTFNNNVITVLLKFGSRLNLIESHHEQKNSFLRSATEQYRDGIGRIIATQPEFENSPMHEGFYIFFSRLVSSIWKKSLWDFKNIPGHLIVDLNRFYKFISDNFNSFTEKRHNFNASINSDEISQRRQNALEFENESLTRLKETCGLLIELLTFLSICMDYKLLDSLRNEPIGIQNAGMNVEMLLTSSKGKSFITELGNILVQKQLRLRAPIRPLCESLRSRCSSFFSEEDVFLQEGLESLERTRLCRSSVERSENVLEALMALKKACKVIPIANLHLIFQQLDTLGFPDCSIMLGLHYIETMDPENIGLRIEFNPNIQLNSDEHEICRQRELIYDRLMESISCTGFDSEKTNILSSSNPWIDIKSLREKCLNLVALSRDELFHYRMYEWLVKSQFSQTLLELPQSEFLYKYLRSTFISRDNSHRDLLWKWLARSCKYSDAASVLATIAETREYLLSLSERIEYLSLAITHCKSAALETSKHYLVSAGFEEISQVELSELEELLEVAHTQYEVLKEARLVLGGRNETVCAELDGLVGLLTVSELFNRYARPYGLIESCLRLIHISGLVNEQLVSQLWQEIISKYVHDRSDKSSFHQLGSKVSELARKFYPSPSAFPLAHIIDVLGRLSLSSEIGADWLVTVLINSGIPLTALADEFHRFLTSPPSKSWLSPSFRVYLLEMISHIFKFLVKDNLNSSVSNPMLISRLKMYALAAEEVQSSELVNDFGMLLKQLASF